MLPKLIATGAALLALAGPAAAERVFFDDFNSESGGQTDLNVQSLTNFDVAGYIDLIAPDNQLGYDVDSTVVDLGGFLTGGGIQLKNYYRWEAGDTVSISFDISGNQLRPDTADALYMELQFEVEPDADGVRYVDVERFWATGWYLTDFGPERLADYYFMSGFEIEGDFPFVRQTINFIPLLGGSVSFYIQTLSGGGYGPLIDNFAVDITSGTAVVPEPASWALMIAGFGLIGAARRRARTAMTVAA